MLSDHGFIMAIHDFEIMLNNTAYVFDSLFEKDKTPGRRRVRWPNFHGQKNLLNLEINYGSEKAKREPTQV
jgi:hypothetical protein